jgi:hypothetical protein
MNFTKSGGPGRFIERHEIGKGSADVDAYTSGHDW